MEQQNKLKILLTFLIFLFAALSLLFFLFAFNREGIEARLGQIFPPEEVVIATQAQSSNTIEEAPSNEEAPTNEVNQVANNTPSVSASPIGKAATPIKSASPYQAKNPSEKVDKNGLDRRVVSQYQVVNGDTVSDIAYAKWGNAYLWPDLYVNNVWRADDPDLIFPGEVIDILNRLGPNGRFTEAEITAINQAYLDVYSAYKRQGPVRNNSTWYTLYSATKVIPNFLERNANELDPADIAKTKQLIEEAKALK